MSEYIYGSSLRAAKSKANYIFDGDFRRRPNQNLSGASRSVARVELLQQAAEQRQTREHARRREDASLKIQSMYRGYRGRNLLSTTLRHEFDLLARGCSNEPCSDAPTFDGEKFSKMSRGLIIFYHSAFDKQRYRTMINLMMQQRGAILEAKKSDPKIWLYRISQLLVIDLNIMDKNRDSSSPTDISIHLDFIDVYTQADTMLSNDEALCVWSKLIGRGYFSILRNLFDTNMSIRFPLELISRPLDTDPQQMNSHDALPAYSFFQQFLHEPITLALENGILNDLIKIQPKHMQPKYILEAFKKSTKHMPNQYRPYMAPDIGSIHSRPQAIQECREAVWLCYLFVKALHNRTDVFNDPDKIDYINIVSVLIEPAEYITNISLIQAANNESDDQNEEDDITNALNASSRTHKLTHYHSEIHNVIDKIVYFLNQPSLIKSLKAIIFSTNLQQQVQGAIVHICNLMLSHEYLAIYNCRLLYTVAFSKEFSRSLWKSIITANSTYLYGASTPIYIQIARGSQTISHESWKSILPKLKLFCSLCSYLLPTLGDEEFYTSDESQRLYSTGQSSNQHLNASSSASGTEISSSISSYYVDKELVGISAILRDLCIGLVEIIYQGTKQTMGHGHASSMRLDNMGRIVGIGSIGAGGFQMVDEQARSTSFEIKSCFQALVRLVCQLHARDSRKQFCPDGHWICPSVVIPANKAIDFQLVTSQQGRLLNQMTRDDQSVDRLSNASSEIKTVLILQEIPFVISFHDRVQIFHQLLRKERQIHQSDGYHFGLPGTAIQVQIRRNYIYEDAFEKLSFDNEPNMKLPLKIALINAAGVDEAGIDGGGLTKEFLGELLKAGFDPMRGFFKYTNDHSLYPNPTANVLFSNLSEGFEVHYEFLGRMLGKAIFEKIMVELPMASFFLAKLLAVKNSSDVDLHNLESLDPILYKNLVYLKNYKGDVADLNLDFTISNNDLGEHEMVELKPGGSKMPVTRENKIEYVHLVADYRLNKQIRSQCAAFKRGLAQLIDLDWLRMFDPKELQILISGAPTVIDVTDWRHHTIYCNGYTDTSPAIQTFWTAVGQMDENSKRKLLKFATSCSLPPLLGFKDLVPQFAIAPSEEERLPTASTCMNLLKLPQIEDEHTMRSKLLYAIESNSGFELS